MKLSKLSNYIESQRLKQRDTDHLIMVDRDLQNVFTAFAGRIRFGTATDGYRGENVAGEFQTFTTHTNTNYEFSVSHGLGSVPQGYIITKTSYNCVLYDGTTSHSSTTMYFRASATTCNLTVFLLK